MIFICLDLRSLSCVLVVLKYWGLATLGELCFAVVILPWLLLTVFFWGPTATWVVLVMDSIAAAGMGGEWTSMILVWLVSDGYLWSVCFRPADLYSSSASDLTRVGRNVAGEWMCPWDGRLLRVAWLVPECSERREVGWGKGSLPVWFRSLTEVEGKQWVVSPWDGRLLRAAWIYPQGSESQIDG